MGVIHTTCVHFLRKRREKMLKKILYKMLSKETAHDPKNTTIMVQPQKVYIFEPNQRELQEILHSPMPKGKAPGYVYFVQEHMNGTFKIGKTKHLEKRMNTFNVKLPFENKLVYVIKTGNHHQTEAAFHKHFSHKRLEGEWFALDKKDIDWIKKGNYTEEINQSISHDLKVSHNKRVHTADDRKPLTAKQVQYAKSLLKKLENDYEFIGDYSSLTQKDLNRLGVYFRYKNDGALNNLVKEGVLRVK